MIRRTRLSLIVLFTGAVCAQRTRSQVVVVPIEDARFASMQLRIPTSNPIDAFLLLEWLDAQLPERGPDQVRSRERSQTSVRFGFTAVREEVDSVLELILGAWRSGIRLEDGELIGLRDRALLRADDESMVLPGPRLRSMVGGVPVLRRSELQWMAGMSPELVRASLERSVSDPSIDFLMIGDVGATAMELVLAEAPKRPGPSGTESPRGGPANDSEAIVDERVSATYLIRSTTIEGGSVACFEPFTWAALTWIESEARQRLPMRGAELAAEAPVFDWDPGTGRVHLIRRGVESRLGEAAPQDPAAEVEAFFGELRARRFTAGSFDSVWRVMRRRLQPQARDLRVASLFHDHALRRLLSGSGTELELPQAGWGELPEAESRQRVEARVAELIDQDWAQAQLDPLPPGDS